jgi:hypothetical protein
MKMGLNNRILRILGNKENILDPNVYVCLSNFNDFNPNIKALKIGDEPIKCKKIP